MRRRSGAVACWPSRPAGHRVLGLEQHVSLDADEVVQEIAQSHTTTRLPPEAERRVVARVGAERAGLELSGALRREGARAERERARQQRDPSHGSWCSSTRRFCARPAAVVLGAIGLAGPYPLATMRLGVTPRVARYIRTASARACDRPALVAAAPVLSV